MIPTTEAVISRLSNGGENYAHLITFGFSNGDVYLTECGFDLEWSGDTYLANGLLLDMDSPKFTEEVRVGEIDIALTAVEQSLLAVLLNTPQYNRQVTVQRALLDDNGKVIPDPILIHTWYIIDYSVTAGTSDAVIALKLASEWADWDKPAGIRTTDASQRRFYPNDRVFEFSTAVKQDLKWGS